MINVVMIDDERLAINNLTYHLQEFSQLNIIGGFTRVDELWECLEKENIQLIFMDIEMPEINGIELAAKVFAKYPKIEIVFATAYDHYAVEAFEINAIDYILKPISKTRLKTTVQRIIDGSVLKPAEKKIYISCLGGFEIYVNEKLIPFKLSKAKEILAYLINKMGRSVGWMSIADDVWEDILDDKKLMNNFHVASFSLRKFLKENDIEEIYDYSRNQYRIDTSKFKCDLFELHRVYEEFLKTKKVITNPQIFRTGELFAGLSYIWSFDMADKVEEMISEMEFYIN